MGETGNVTKMANTGDVVKKAKTGDVTKMAETGDVTKSGTGRVTKVDAGNVTKKVETGDVTKKAKTGDVRKSETRDVTEADARDVTKKAETGDVTKKAETGYVTKADTGDITKKVDTVDVTKKAKTGDVTEMAETGDVTKSETGDVTKKAEREDVIKKIEIGDVTKKTETGDVTMKAETGYVTKMAKTGDVTKIAETGDVTKSKTGDVTKVDTGDVTKKAETRDVTKKAETGDVTKMAKTGDVTTIAETGDVTKSETGDVTKTNTGDVTKKVDIGDVTKMAETTDVTKSESEDVTKADIGDITKKVDTGEVTKKAETGDVTKMAKAGDITKKAETGDVTNMPKTGDVTKASPQAPDGGWSWVVIACAFFNAVIIVGIPVTFGVVFNEKLTMMGVSSTTVTWIYNLFNFNLYISSVFCGALSDVFSWRSVGFVTATITGAAYVSLAFSSSPGLIFLLFSVVVGCNVGLASFVGFLVLPHYFDIYRGRAGAIMMTGVSTSQMIIPLLIRWLLDEYGFSGACLLFAGLVFNCAVLNLLFYPVRRRPLLKGDLMYEAARKNVKAQVTLKKKVSESNQIGKINEKRPKSLQSRSKILKEIFWITRHHMCQVKRTTLLIVTLSSSLLMVGYGNFTALLPFAMAAGGHSAAEISYSLAIGALANTAVRIFVCWASDADWFSRKISFILGSVVSGVSTLAIVFVLDDSQWIIVSQIFWGVGIGANLSVYNNLLIDVCGRELYNAGVAITSLMTAVCNIILGPLIGVASDFTSYNVGLGLTAALQMMCALIWIFMPLARRQDLKKFPDPQSPNQELDGKLNRSSGISAFNRERKFSSYINEGFVTDLGLDSSKRHSVC